MRTAIAILIAVAASACSPGMHRAYQNTMGIASIAGFGVGAGITYNELNSPGTSYRETRPTFGMSPKTFPVAFMLINVAVVAGIRLMPDDLFDQYTPWIKDIGLTSMAIDGVADGYGDWRLTH